MLHSSRFSHRVQESLRKQSRVMGRARRFRQLMSERLEERTVLAAQAAPHELLVQFNPGVSESAKAQSLTLVQGSVMEFLQKEAGGVGASNGVQRIELPTSMSLDAAIATLKNNPNVKYAEPNWLYQPSDISNDTNYLSGGLWGMYSDDSPAAIGPSGTTNQFGSQAEEAWNAGYTGDRSIVVGIIDEGFQTTHPDLINNTWVNPHEVAGDNIDNDGNGYVDDIHGWDFFNNDNTVYDGTGDDHGTHVAGTIGGEGGNGLGVAGVNWKTTMISAKFLGPTGGFTSDAVEALDYLTDLKTRHGINIVATNNSWGGGGFSQSLLDAITRAANAGILFVAAAGNANANNDATASYPSNYNTTASAGYDAVIAVAAIDNSGARASFSSYGANNVDLGAPGVSINSTLPTNGYGNYSGTSMATPHVTGAAALYAAANPGASANAIRSAILSSVTPTTSLNGLTVTGGRLNISALMQGTPVLPSLSISNVTQSEGNSGSTNFGFTVTLSAASATPVTVNYATANGTATSGSDYVAVTSTPITFAPGALTQTVNIVVNGDTTTESNETFFVNLAGVSTNATIADSQGVGTINNDDTVLPGLSINDVSITEGNRNQRQLTFTISLSQAATSNVRVDYVTSNGTGTGAATAGVDYRSASGRATIRAGRTSTTVSVTIYGDQNVEPNETFFVTLSNPTTNSVITDALGIGTILNDDPGGAGGTVSGNGFGGSIALGDDNDASSVDALLAAGFSADEQANASGLLLLPSVSNGTSLDKALAQTLGKARSTPDRNRNPVT
jgi:subtilisin family serine protease